MKTKQKKGISLIVLVITIIVMIILAAVIILSLSSSGIIGRANQATQITNEAQLKQLANLALADAYADGIKDKKEAKEYVKNKLADSNVNLGEYNIVITDNGVVLKTGYSVSFVFFEGREFNGKKVAEKSISSKVKSLQKIDNKVVLEFDEGEMEFDILEGVYPFDVLNSSDFGLGGVFDSNNSLVQDLSSTIEYDDYTIVFVSDEQQIELIQSGDYYLATQYWETGWFETPYMNYSGFAKAKGYKFEKCDFKVKKNGIEIHNSFILDEDFKDVKQLVEKIDNDIDGKYDEYSVESMYGLAMMKNGKVVLQMQNDELTGVPFPYPVMYDLTDENKIPNSVRNKYTKEIATDFYERLEEAKKVNDDGTAAAEVIDEHEYFVELKCCILEYNVKFTLNI